MPRSDPRGPRLRGLPPLLPPPGRPVRALILGSFPSAESLRKQQYYGHAQNWFWRMLERCGVVADQAAPYEQRVAELAGKGLAIWDLYANVRRLGSGDDAIRDARTNDVPALWRAQGPFPILLNGRRRAEWRRNFPGFPQEPLALPSTSPRPVHWNTPQSAAAALAEWCEALRTAGVV